MKQNLLIVFCALFFGKVNSQTYESFSSHGKYGVRNKYDGKVVLFPKYYKIVGLNDSMVIIQNHDHLYGVINMSDSIVVPFAKERLSFDTFDMKHLGQLIEEPSNLMLLQYYYIDFKRNCIPYDDCNCPPYKKLTDKVSPHLELIQRGISFCDNGNRDSADFYFDKAINCDPTNHFSFLSKAKSRIFDKKRNFIKPIERLTENDLKVVNQNLDKAYELSSLREDQIFVLDTKYRVIKHSTKDKKELKGIDNKLNILKAN